MRPISHVWKKLAAQKHYTSGVKLQEQMEATAMPSLRHPCEEFVKALEHDPFHSEAWKRAFATGPSSDHLTKLSTIASGVLKDNPRDVLFLSWRAKIMELLGNEKQALESYNSILEIDPRVDQAWTGKGRILKKVSRLRSIPDINRAADVESYFVQNTFDQQTRQAAWAYRQGFHEIAVARLRPLAKEGKAHAQFLLGRLYLQGLGVEKNMTLGVSLCKKAAVGGDPVAEWMVSIWYQHGIVLEKNEEEGFKWLKKAAEHQFPRAQLELGECYEWGYQIDRNLSDALFWYEQAAQNGYWKAYERIAEFYARYGKSDIKQEKIRYWLKQLVEWHESLAIKGSKESIEYLIRFYLEGGPVSEVDMTDYQRARLWAKIGAAKGIKSASDLFRMMTIQEPTKSQ